jgi:hypothetical protein
MAWVPVSLHGIDPNNPADRLTDALAMVSWGNMLYVAAFRQGQAREAELWKAIIGDENWTLVGVISGMRRPETMGLYNNALYVGGISLNNDSAKLVRVSPDDAMTDIALPVRSNGLTHLPCNLRSLNLVKQCSCTRSRHHCVSSLARSSLSTPCDASSGWMEHT